MRITRSYKRKITICVVVNVLLLFTLSSWLRPTQEQWFPNVHKGVALEKDNFVQRFPSKRHNLNKTLRILLWTPWFGESNWFAEPDTLHAFSGCSHSRCSLTKDKSDITMADAVVFHSMDLWNKFLGYPLPEYRRSDQVWILYNQEPPPHSPTDLEKYHGVFNWTASYRKDSDISIPYFNIHTKIKAVPVAVKDIASTKSAGIAWVASNCGDDARRQMLVREIDKYYPVDTYGSCGKTSLPRENLNKVLMKYKFYLAFENSYCRNYVTEKLLEPLRSNIIPVAVGGPYLKKLAPPHSYIDVTDFNSVEDLTQYLKYLDTDHTAYNSYFQWTGHYRLTGDDHWCAMCEALHDEGRPHQVYTNMAGYVDNDTCQRWTIQRYLARMLQGYAMKYGLI